MTPITIYTGGVEGGYFSPHCGMCSISSADVLPTMWLGASWCIITSYSPAEHASDRVPCLLHTTGAQNDVAVGFAWRFSSLLLCLCLFVCPSLCLSLSMSPHPPPTTFPLSLFSSWLRSPYVVDSKLKSRTLSLHLLTLSLSTF